MKQIIVLLLLINTASIFGQSKDEDAIKAVIGQLFDGMRANDSLMTKPLFIDNAIISSVFRDQNGQTIKRSNVASAFITATGTPHEGVWDEKIWSYTINIDDPIAFAWTDYTFFASRQLSHCGVNMFELLKINGNWKIAAITDTRRKTNCYTEDNVVIHQLLDNWHHAASVADEDVFFGSMSDDAIYIGTDATERWTKSEMISLLGKYFEKETAWSFAPISRQITLSVDGQTAWFDELLDTWMGDCRGSGVLTKKADKWQISHYHLAIAVPNDKVDGYLELIGKPRKTTANTEVKN